MPDVLSGGTTNSWDRRWKQVGVIAAVVGAVVGTVALWPIFFSAPPPHDGPTPPPGYAFTDPPPGMTAEKPCAFEARGTGLPPAGKDIAVVNQEVNGRLYFESAVTKDPQHGSWRVSTTVGTPETKVGTLFRLSVIEMDATWEQYLAGVIDETGASYWSSPGLPPGGQVVATAEIKTNAVCEQ